MKHFLFFKKFFFPLSVLRPSSVFQKVFFSLYALDFSLCLISAVLLVFSHPPHNMWFLAWIGLVPLFFALQGKNVRQCFGLGYLAGLFYFFGMFWWFIHVTLPGMILLNMFLALYFAFFAATYALIQKRPLFFKVVLTACAWVAWEFARSRLLTGFGWAALGHSQYQQIWLIQIAELAGVYGISFLLVVMNFFFYFIFRYWNEKKIYGKEIKFFASLALVLLAGVWLHGYIDSLVPVSSARAPLKVAVVQPNIAQEDKWNPRKSRQIIGILKDLTRRASEQNPDLIVWPESSLPSIPEYADYYLEQVQSLAEEIKVPVLLGYVRQGIDGYYNSAVLVNSDGLVSGWYDKIHLVPFGEYVPLRNIFPFLSDIVPIGDIFPGKEPAVFFFSKKKLPSFSTLICFEDTDDQVPRLLVNSGAEILINITNDAWFNDTKASWLHLQAAVIQTASYERPLVRAANTGVSAFVSADGRIEEILKDKNGKAVFHAGTDVWEVLPGKGKTFRLMFGDVFAYLCIACLLGNAIIIFTAKKFFIKSTGGNRYD